MIIDKDDIKILLIILILGLGIGYAYINSDLNINGTAQVNSANWDVHWANVQVSTGSVSASSPTISNQTTVNYSVVLNTPGDYYEFTVDAVNGGSIDAMIDSIDSKLNGATITTLPEYLNYTVTYSDGVELAPNHQLLHNTTEKYKVRIEYRTDINANQLPASNQTLSLQFTVTYRQATDDSIEKLTPFAGHSWETMASNVRSGNTSMYSVGDTRKIDMGSYGTHTIRIANMSTPSECNANDFSQTACGFVLEFEDIITTRQMNSTATSEGGWPATELRTYLNNDIYNLLPSDLRNKIINTTVVSGHNITSGQTNFVSTDKIYLLNMKEIYNTTGYDSAQASTRQLDYYNNLEVTYGSGTTNNTEGAIKKYNTYGSSWWTRTASGSYTTHFYVVTSTGGNTISQAHYSSGVSPAFRIG